MKILITGGAGFVCSHLADKLYEKGHSLILLDNLLTGNVKNIEHLLSNDNVDFMEHDVQNHIEISDDVDSIRAIIPLTVSSTNEKLLVWDPSP